MSEEDAAQAPTIIVFAGPNGSGKSTITKALAATDFKGEYINADDIAKSLEAQMPDYLQRNLAAAGIAEQRRLEAIAEKRSFAFETVMSTPEKVAILTQAKAAGYTVTLVFVTTSDPELNVQRVANRVALGGHDVDPAKIRERWHAAMDLLPAALEHADAASVYDNSRDVPYEVATKRDNELHLNKVAAQIPWVQEKLAKPYIERMASRRRLGQIVAQATQAHPSRPAELRDADAGKGRQYSGEIAGVTDRHALQKLSSTDFVLHDRALTPPQAWRPGQYAKVEYAYSKGKIVEPARDQRSGPER